MNEFESININESIKKLDLSTRGYKRLINNGITTIAELLDYTEDQLLKFEGLGSRTITQIKDVLWMYDLVLKGQKPYPTTWSY